MSRAGFKWQGSILLQSARLGTFFCICHLPLLVNTQIESTVQAESLCTYKLKVAEKEENLSLYTCRGKKKKRLSRYTGDLRGLKV